MTDNGSFREITDTTVQHLHDYYKLPTGQLSPDPTVLCVLEVSPLRGDSHLSPIFVNSDWRDFNLTSAVRTNWGGDHFAVPKELTRVFFWPKNQGTFGGKFE